MNDNPTAADLTVRDIWDLIRYAFTAVLACTIVFIVPYLIFSGAELAVETVGGQAATRWIGVAIWLVILYFIVSNLNEISEDVSRFFSDIAKLTRGMSFFKKATLVILFSLSLYGWQRYPQATFFISVLVVIPTGFTYDRYIRIIEEKKSAMGEANSRSDT